MEPEGLYTANQWIVAACMLLVILAGSEVGRWLGGRVLARKPGTQGARIEAFENALLGLLSLMIGFTFSLALNRFEQRKAEPFVNRGIREYPSRLEECAPTGVVPQTKY